MIAEHTHKKKVKIMMVDDDPMVLKLLSHYLKKQYPSSESHLFGNPVDALKYYRGNYRNIDIVILDMMMSNMNGLELSMEIKNINKNERIILMTAYSFDAMITQKGAQAVEFFLPKIQMNPSLKKLPSLLDFYVKKILWIKDMQIKCLKAQSELKRSEAKTRTIVTSIGEGIISAVAAPDLTIDYVNQEACKIFGYLEEELVGQSLTILIPDKYRVDHIAGMKRYLSEGKQKILGKRIELEGLRKDGSTFPLELKVEEAKGGGCNSFFTAAIRDITERRKAEEERYKIEEKLRETQKLESLGVLAGGIAHDFNNILTGILCNSDLALDNLSPDSTARNYIEKIQEETKRAAELSIQMLAYSGKGKFVIENIDINEIIKEMAHMLEVSMSKKHNIKYDLTEYLPFVEVDVTQIRQVIMNLIINASEAIGENNGVISITTGAMKCDKDCFKRMYLREDLPGGFYNFIEVADTGMGMDEETIKKIFDPFFTTKFTGRGLGMSAVLGIIRGHKGAINVESEPGKGTKFTVFLPSSKKTSSTTKPDREKNAESWRGHGKVLVVDDDKSVREVGKDMLETIGFNVITAVDGQEAIEILRDRSNEIDCVLLDLSMPRMNGEECFHELRKIRQDVRIIIYSGYSEEETAQRFFNQGVNGFLQKPFNLKMLINKMRKVSEND